MSISKENLLKERKIWIPGEFMQNSGPKFPPNKCSNKQNPC